MTQRAVDRMVGPWRVKSEAVVYDNPWIRVTDHGVLHPDGSPGQYGVVHFKNFAIGILPIDREGYVWLVGQYRFALDTYSWELPEGGGPLQDAPIDAAKRELQEETGLTAACWTPLLASHVSNSVTDEVAFGFLATDLCEGVASPEPSEALTLKRVPFKDVLRAVLSGEITDSLTQLMVLTAHTRALSGGFSAEICDTLRV